jgi:hypothetical protein
MSDYDSEELYEETDVDTMRKWLEGCESAAEVPLHRGGTDFNEWERSFIESIREQFDERTEQGRSKPLSGKQLVTLRRLYDRT